MKTQEYEQRNALGFEGDEYIAEKIKELIDQFKINWMIETGTYHGNTTARLASMCEMVSTIEVNQEFYTKASRRISELENVTIHYGDSVSILPQLLGVTLDKNIFLFLDSHWENDLPLLAELEIIKDHKHRHRNIVICIHDFRVPNRPDLGFDSYGKVTLEWDYIKASIELIYGVGGYKKEYNDRATGAKRGVIYIMPT